VAGKDPQASQDPSRGGEPVEVRLTPPTAAGQAELERWIVHMEALGHRMIPWGQLPPFHQRRLAKRVRRMRRRLRNGRRVQVSYGTRPARSSARPGRRPLRGSRERARRSTPRRRAGTGTSASSVDPPAGDEPPDDPEPALGGLSSFSYRAGTPP
jgi:hypothetical protein